MRPPGSRRLNWSLIGVVLATAAIAGLVVSLAGAAPQLSQDGTVLVSYSGTDKQSYSYNPPNASSLDTTSTLIWTEQALVEFGRRNVPGHVTSPGPWGPTM